MKTFDLKFQWPVELRYGENPHQQGWVWQEKTKDALAFFKYKQLQGKQLSFNNYLDIEGAVEALSLIGQQSAACVVVKHTNPCGASVDKSVKRAFARAWAGDSLAAFGGVVAVNRKINEALAKLMLGNKRFFEVLLCPEISPRAGKVFAEKQNLRVLVNSDLKRPKPEAGFDFKKIRGGLLVQEADVYQLKARDLKVVTQKKPAKKQLADLMFAWKICQVSKANAIVLAKNQQLIASGVGQQDRFRCCQLAVSKAGKRAVSSVAASDAFFPFKDGPEILIRAGVKAMIQPGGSIRDQETIDLCDKNKIAMVLTSIRCFRH